MGYLYFSLQVNLLFSLELEKLQVCLFKFIMENARLK